MQACRKDTFTGGRIIVVIGDQRSAGGSPGPGAGVELSGGFIPVSRPGSVRVLLGRKKPRGRIVMPPGDVRRGLGGGRPGFAGPVLPFTERVHLAQPPGFVVDVLHRVGGIAPGMGHLPAVIVGIAGVLVHGVSFGGPAAGGGGAEESRGVPLGIGDGFQVPPSPLNSAVN